MIRSIDARDRARSLAKAFIPTRNVRRLTVLLALTWWGSVLLMFALEMIGGVPAGVGTETPWGVWLAMKLESAIGTSGMFTAMSVPFVVIILSRAGPVKRVYESLLSMYLITAPMMVTERTTGAIDHAYRYPDVSKAYVQSEFLSAFTEPLALMVLFLIWVLPLAVAWWALERYRPGYLSLGSELETEQRGVTDD